MRRSIIIVLGICLCVYIFVVVKCNWNTKIAPVSEDIAITSTGFFDLSGIKEQINKLVNEEATRELTVANCKPDKRITTLMREIDSIGQKLMSQENQTDDIMGVSEKCLAILSALRERRIYCEFSIFF